MPKLSTKVSMKPARLFTLWKDYVAKDSEAPISWKLETNNMLCTSLTPSESSLLSTLNRVNGGENLYWYVIPLTAKGARIHKVIMRNGVANGLPCFRSPLDAMAKMKGNRRPVLNTPFQLLAVFEKNPKATKSGLEFNRAMVICAFTCSLVRGQQRAYTAMNAFRNSKVIKGVR